MKPRKSKEDQVVTLGNCFICLNPCSKSKIVDETSHSALDLLCRHLDIEAKTEVKAIMCEKCDKTLGMISEHLLLMEVCQMKVNFWLGQVQTNISKTKESFGKLIEHYDAGYVEQFKEVVGLREAIFGKCKLRTSNLLPRIALSRVELPLASTFIKTEEEEETDITDNQFDNGFENNDEECGSEEENDYAASSSSSSSPTFSPFEKDDSSASFTDSDETIDESRSSSPKKSRPRSADNGRNRTCHICAKSLLNKWTLSNHIKYVHKTVPKHKCGTCGKLVKTRQSLQRHEAICKPELLSNPDFKHACNICDRRCKNHRTLRYHKLIFHSDIRKYKCDLCPLTFKLSHGLKEHKRTVHDKIQFPCEIKGCGKSFPRNSIKWVHMMKEHNLHGPPPPHGFRDKNRLPVAPSMYTDHFTKKIAEDGKILFECNYCEGINYKQFSSFTKHYKEIHAAKASGNSITCHISDKISASDKALSIKWFHQTDRNIQCDLCGKLFKEAKNMRLHKESCSLKPAAKPDYKHACNLCGNRFRIPSQLSRHKQLSHSDIRNFKCDICSQSFKTSYTLKDHKRAVHDKIKRITRFPCDIQGCSKSFFGNSTKWLHMNKEHNLHGPPPPPGYRNRSVPPSSFADHFTKTIASETKTYQCNYCEDTTFKTLPGFITHYKAIHVKNKVPVKSLNYKGHYTKITGEKGEELIKCNYCDKEYKSVNTFARHYKSAHLKLTFQCEMCGVTKDRQSCLKHHIAKEHAVT